MGSDGEPQSPPRWKRKASSPSPKPSKSAKSSHLPNGNVHVERKNSRASIGAKERERLQASILLTTNKRREAIDLEQVNGDGHHHPSTIDLGNVNDHGNHPSSSRPTRPSDLEVEARDPRDEAPAPVTRSRVPSPYTLNPPIDFDGLSWPSKLRDCFQCQRLAVIS